MAFTQTLRRLREKKTNYRRRSTMLMSKREFITVQISNENIQVQIHKPELLGDMVIASAHSRFLLDKGWKGSRKSISASYLTGYFAGKKALSKGLKNAILYSGTGKYTQRMAAALKGVIDAGLEIPADQETFPASNRIKGEHLKVKNDTEKIKSAIDGEVKKQ
ncbi:MAG: 50S ribosomal protein L18 [Nitrosopumilales archaeon]|nr:50S ribosomal protein L18 [Nitrosopumilales archaeon]